MDSRDHLESTKWKMNARDISTLNELISIESVPRNSHISFHKDEEDFRFAIADITAFIVRRQIGMEESKFMDPLRGKIKVRDLSEKKRGR